MIELPEAPRICVVLLTGLGDVIHGLPVVNALKRRWPAAHITWVVEPMPAAVLSPHPSIDHVIIYHKQRGLAGLAQLRRELQTQRFDLALNLNVYFKSAWPMLFSRATIRLGFERGRAKDGIWLAANRHLPRAPRQHTQDMFLEFLDALGVAPEPVEWRLQLTAAERTAQREFIDSLDGQRYVALVPASANEKKDWVPERMAQVADEIAQRYDLRTVLIGGPGAREAALARRIVERAQQPPAWALGDGVRRLLWLIDAAELVIAPDTGPVHIARALGTPVIGLYGHTNPWRVGPYRMSEDLWVDAYTDGTPDPSNFEPKLGRMERITVADVMTRVAGVLSA